MLRKKKIRTSTVPSFFCTWMTATIRGETNHLVWNQNFGLVIGTRKKTTTRFHFKVMTAFTMSEICTASSRVGANINTLNSAMVGFFSKKKVLIGADWSGDFSKIPLESRHLWPWAVVLPHEIKLVVHMPRRSVRVYR